MAALMFPWFKKKRAESAKARTAALTGRLPARILLTGSDGTRIAARVRRASADDAIELDRWPPDAWFDWPGLVQGKASARRPRAPVDYKKPVRIYVLEVGEGMRRAILGASAVLFEADGNPRLIEIAYLETRRDCPYRGVGTALLAAAVDEALRRGDALFLDALIRSGCIPFYERLGMITIPGTPWPTVTSRMAFTDATAAERFLNSSMIKMF